jgi:syntaxin 1B/2/3
LSHEATNYSQTSNYSQGMTPVPTQLPSQPLSRDDFLARVEGCKSRINELTSNVAQIGTLHQRMISSPDNSAQAQLENLVSQTQLLNTGIKDEIKYLEKDVSRDQSNTLKQNQIRNLQGLFRTQLQDYQRQESDYERRYRDAIARQYRIVNPDATEDEIQEAANANWGNEGVFQTAVSVYQLLPPHISPQLRP